MSTKAELQAQVNALEARNDELRASIADLQAVNVVLDARNTKLCQDLHAVTMERTSQPARVMPAWQAQRAADMAEARAIAMATGRCIKV